MSQSSPKSPILATTHTIRPMALDMEESQAMILWMYRGLETELSHLENGAYILCERRKTSKSLANTCHYCISIILSTYNTYRLA